MHLGHTITKWNLSSISLLSQLIHFLRRRLAVWWRPLTIRLSDGSLCRNVVYQICICRMLSKVLGPYQGRSLGGEGADAPPPWELFQKYFSVDFPANLRVATKS